MCFETARALYKNGKVKYELDAFTFRGTYTHWHGRSKIKALTPAVFLSLVQPLHDVNEQALSHHSITAAQ